MVSTLIEMNAYARCLASAYIYTYIYLLGCLQLVIELTVLARYKYIYILLANDSKIKI